MGSKTDLKNHEHRIFTFNNGITGDHVSSCKELLLFLKNSMTAIIVEAMS